MFVHDGPRGIFGKFQRVTRIPHGEGKRTRFIRIQAAKVNSHEESSHLVVGHLSFGKSVHRGLNLPRRKHVAVAFSLEERQRIHALPEKSAGEMPDYGTRVVPAETK